MDLKFYLLHVLFSVDDLFYKIFLLEKMVHLRFFKKLLENIKNIGCPGMFMVELEASERK